MKGGERSSGYTIIEVMIVLAISGLMFLIAAQFISGKQELTSFDKGVNDLATEIEGVIEQVSDGKYSDINIGCSLGGLSLSIDGTGLGQGSNQDCVFLGKFMHFYTPPQKLYEVFTLAAARITSSGDPITALNQLGSSVTPVAPYGVNIGKSPELTSQAENPEGLTVQKIYWIGPPLYKEQQIYGFGFVQDLGSIAVGVGNTYNPGTHPIDIAYATNLGSVSTESSAYNALVSTAISPSPLQTLTGNSGVVVCLTDGKRMAELIVGTNSGAAATDTNGNYSVDIKQFGIIGSQPLCP